MKTKRLILIFFLLFSLFIVGCSKTQPEESQTLQQEDQVTPEVSQTLQQEDQVTPEVSQTLQQEDQNIKLLKNDEFLKSNVGLDFQASAWKLAKAYFNGDSDYLKNNLLDAAENSDIYNEENGFSKIDYMIFRFFDYDDAEKEAYGEFIVLMENSDSRIYLDFRMVLDNGVWKIKSYGLDA